MKSRFYLLVLSSFLSRAVLSSPVVTADVTPNGEPSTEPSLSSKTIYLIRHAEKPEDREDRGLSAEGVLRSRCIKELFGSDSGRDIGFITAAAPYEDRHLRHKLTVDPLAKSLGLSVDTSCVPLRYSNDFSCLRRVTDDYFRTSTDDKAVLISWKHTELSTVARVLGVWDSPKRGWNGYNHIWTFRNGTFVSKAKQNCPGLDDFDSPSEYELENAVAETPTLQMQF